MMYRIQRLALAFTLALGLSGCGAPPVGIQAGESDQATAQKHKADALSLIVLPDMGHGSLVNAIRGAQKSIKVQTYIFTNYDASAELVKALTERAKAGVDVQVIIEANPYIPPKPLAPGELPAFGNTVNKETIQALIAGGVRVKRSSPKFRYTHQKTLLIDDQTAYIMTLNFTNSGLTTNREYAVVDRDASDVAEIKRIFSADWDEVTYLPKDPDLVVSPNNSRQRILNLIDSAKKTLVVQCEFVSDPEIAQHLGARAKAGVDVKVMMAHFDKDPNTGRDSNADSLALLTGQGVNQVLFGKSIKMHAKMILADGARAYIGSENLTSNSLDNNREMGVLVQDKAIVETLAKVSSKDWAAR